mgnify:CR=1 FL=1
MADSHGAPTDHSSWGEEDASMLLESIQQLTDIGIWSYDVAAEKSQWSEQAKAIHNVDAAATPSLERIIETYVEDDREHLRAAIAGAIEEQEPFEIDAEFIGGETRNRFIRLNCTPQVVGEETAKLHGTAMEITEAKRRAQRIEVLRRTSQRLKRTKSRENVVEIIADASKNILGLVNTTIRLVDESAETLRTVLSTEECVELAGERPDYPVDGDNPAARVYRTGDPEIFSDIQSADDGWDRGELVSGMYVPIGTYGVLSTGFVVADTFDEQDLEATSLLCQVGADALTRISWVKRSRVV